MGEARRRLDRRARGQSYRPPRVCPNCHSIAVTRLRKPRFGLSLEQTDYDICRQCTATWEAYPDNWCEDVVGAEPCDNCAFSAKSPEQLDRKEWITLVEKLRNGGVFLCHKGVPIVFDKDKGSARFDFHPDDPAHNRRYRWCAGFARMVWAMRDKGEDWINKRHAMMTAGDAAGETEDGR